eukprot:6120786-Pyramimonas_sp.AAC.1
MRRTRRRRRRRKRRRRDKEEKEEKEDVEEEVSRGGVAVMRMEGENSVRMIYCPLPGGVVQSGGVRVVSL